MQCYSSTLSFMLHDLNQAFFFSLQIKTNNTTTLLSQCLFLSAQFSQQLLQQFVVIERDENVSSSVHFNIEVKSLCVITQSPYISLCDYCICQIILLLDFSTQELPIMSQHPQARSQRESQGNLHALLFAIAAFLIQPLGVTSITKYVIIHIEALKCATV